MIKRGMAKMASFIMALPALESSLRLYRTEQAFVRSVPAGSIFTNKLMHEIAATRPNTLKQLLALRGMGSRRCKAYGKDIIKLVSTAPKGKKATKPAKRPSTSSRPKPKPKPKPRPRPRPACDREWKPDSEDERVLSLDAPCKPVPPLCKSDPALCKSCPLITAPEIYALELEDGRVYVGSSRNVDRRVAQHQSGSGSAFTRAYKPTGVRLPRLGNISGDGDAAERDETLRYMYERGIAFVRGWKFTQVAMPPEEFDEAEANIRELFDLCRKCGYKGHFMAQCKATYDRWGKAV
jgi:predicted GIY-YIG superfamily endonuclease